MKPRKVRSRSGATDSHRKRVVIAGLGDTGLLIATRLARTCDVVAVSTREALVSGQELGTRLTNLQQWRRNYLVPYARFRRLDSTRTLHGRITSIDLESATVEIATPEVPDRISNAAS